MGLFDRADQLTKAEAFAQLRARNAVKAVVAFSGGNDEGGADGYTLHLADGTTVDLDVPGVQPYSGWDEATKRYVEDPNKWGRHDYQNRQADGTVTWTDAKPDEVALQKLLNALEAPIYDRWGSFAGDFYVNGECIWEVDGEKVHLTGTEEVPVGQGFDDYV